MNQIRQTGRNYDSDAKVERLIRHWRLQTSIVGDRWLMPYQRECRQSEDCRRRGVHWVQPATDAVG
jgi:hypothetical protein